MNNDLPLIPTLRLGRPYESLDRIEVKNYRSGEVLAHVSQVHGGVIRRDLLNRLPGAFEALQRIPSAKLMEICARAGELFMNATLPLGAGHTQSPDAYVATLSSTSGLPHNMCRRNMAKIHEVLTEMPTILKGLTRGLALAALDTGIGTQNGVPVCFFAVTKALGAVLPSNSPGVNSLWLPSIALKIPVVLKPGREEPWTPFRVIQAFIEAGCPAEAFGFYPTDHAGARDILELCGRAQLFGDDRTTAPYRDNPGVEIHGAGRSKILIGADEIENWEAHLDVMVESIMTNGGRSCVNASGVWAPKYGREIAEALAKRLGPVKPSRPDDPEAQLSGFANPAFAEYIDGAIETDLRVAGATDATAAYRDGPRHVIHEGGHYLRPTIIHCTDPEHPLANREFLCPFASVVEAPAEELLARIGPSLVVTAITRDEDFCRQLLLATHIDRLNLGPVPTMHVRWDQPHEGNLFEFLYHRRAFQKAGVLS